ncbi:hypothetical protein EFS45_02350 [Lactobacillus crispatus]|nr:hypothetical protein [Lactobacillus crispatus]
MNDWLDQHKSIDIKSVRLKEFFNGQLIALVMYEEKRNRHLQQKKFNLSEGEDPNEFMKNHDVVNVSTLRDEGWDELITVVTYEDEENDKD